MPKASIRSTKKTLKGLQITRAIAVGLVLYAHSDWVLPDNKHQANVGFESFFDAVLNFGYAGVDLFFVISGFIISYISYNRSFIWKDYATRRIIRIYPFYFIFSISWLLLLYVFASAAQDITPSKLLASFLIFPLRDVPILGVGWSLEHEILFYLIAGLLLAMGMRHMIGGVIGGLFAIGCILHGLLPFLGFPDPWDFHVFSLFHFEFLLGVAAFEWRNRITEISPKIWLVLTIIFFFFTSLAVGYNQFYVVGSLHDNVYPMGLIGMLRVIGYGLSGFCLIATALCIDNTPRISAKVPLMGLAVLAGDASYTIYLSHPIILQAIDTVISVFPVQDSLVLFVRLFAAFTAIAVGMLLFKFFESPFLIWLNRRVRARSRPTPKPSRE